MQLAALLCCHSAQAQGIKKCMIAGHMVYQATPCAPEAPAAIPAAATKVAAAPLLVAPKKKTLADLLRERDGGANTSSTPREVQGDGANLLRSRMGAL